MLAKEGITRFPSDYMIAIDAAKAMLHTNDHNDALAILENVELLPFEGASEGKQIYELVNNALALQKIKHANYQGAIKDLHKAKEWPENLGVGKPFEPNEILQNYLLAKVFDKMGQDEQSKKHSKNVIDYFEANKNFDDPKVALVVDLLRSSSQHKKLHDEITNSVTNKNILRLLEYKPLDEDAKSILLLQIEKALSLN